MGAWGYKVFEDDSALDCLDDLMESNPIEYFKSSFAAVIDSDYIEYDDCQAAIVSSCVIDIISNGVKYDGIEIYNSWIQENKNLMVQTLQKSAAQALKLVLSDKSELNELWKENTDEYPKWREYISNIISRLDS